MTVFYKLHLYNSKIGTCEYSRTLYTTTSRVYDKWEIPSHSRGLSWREGFILGSGTTHSDFLVQSVVD